MDEKERALDAQVTAVVKFIDSNLQDVPEFNDLVDALIKRDELASIIRQRYLESSVGDTKHQAIEETYTEVWRAVEQEAMQYVTAKMVVKYYG